MDCLEGMAQFPDKYFDLAIVDPPYGIENKISIGGKSHTKSNCKFHQMYSEKNKSWDKKLNNNYFAELFRISKNQIMWGGNYYSMPPTSCFIIWDKLRYVKNYSRFEYAWTSFDTHPLMFTFCNNAGFILKPENKKFHPTQKPIDLYRWLLHNYAKPDFKIIDTHAGSCSSIIAFLDYGCDWIAFEIDEDYYEAASKRIEIHKQQLKLF